MKLVKALRHFAAVCVLLWATTNCLQAQDRLSVSNDSQIHLSAEDSFQQLVQFYDSLSPDSQYLDILRDSTEDSLIQVSVRPDPIVPPEDPRALGAPLQEPQQLWVFVLFLLISILVGVVRFVNPGMHDHILAEVFKLKKRDKEDEPRQDVKSVIMVLFFIIQNLVFAFAIWAFTDYDSLFTFDGALLDYLFILTALLVFLLLKYFAYKFTGDVLALPSFSSATLTFISAVGYVLALFLTPLLALKYYNRLDDVQNIGFWIIAGLFVLYVFYRSLKLILASYRNFTYQKIYLFIYLCAVEILPVVLIVDQLAIFG